jgi:D-lactate dehydrogenase (cytochrome)
VEAGVSLAALEDAARKVSATYPPRPTFTGAFAGGSVATNAAGAATFKYGSTREWVEALTVILANGEALDLARGQSVASEDGFVINTAGPRSRRDRPGILHGPVWTSSICSSVPRALSGSSRR